MNKSEFINEIATKTRFRKVDVIQILNAIQETVTEELVKGEKVAWTGWGTWSSSITKPRTCRNPRSGDLIECPSKRKGKFSFSAPFKRALNEETVEVQETEEV